MLGGIRKQRSRPPFEALNMAEVMAIVGLASSIATFIQIGFEIIKKGREVLESGHGMANEARGLTLIIKDIDNQVEKFLEYSHKGHPEKQVTEIRSMAAECKRVSHELQRILDTLALRENARSRTLEAGRAMIAAFSKKEQITSLTERLERLEKRLRAHVSAALASDRHSDVMRELQLLKRMHERQEVYNPRLDTLEADIARLVQNEANGETTFTQCTASLTSLATKLVVLERERELYYRQLKIVESLYFPELKRRHSDVADANAKTEKWLFDEKYTSFSKWLQSGNGVYWINGLPGSGKSTLMKYICQHPDTYKNLRTWASHLELHTADYFFWNQGHPLQKSLHGLIQSLLYQIARQMPDVILDICGDRPEFEVWELGELKEVLKLLLQREYLNTKFCFFIDGLDEYNGDGQDVVDVVESLAKSSHIKICVSSRPWRVFEESFTDSDKTLIVQDLTKDDMITFVHDEIAENANFKRLKSRDPNCGRIIDDIALRAKGVWLWVYLVSRDIKKALNGREEYDTLEAILDAVPPDLFAYFEAIIKRIDHVHRKDMAKIFLITVSAVSPLPLYAFAFLDQPSCDVEIKPVNSEDVNGICQSWKERIRTRCSDLLITRKSDDVSQVFYLRVDFLHRTVRDWLQDNFFTSLQKELGDNSFDPRMTLCEMSLCLLKTHEVIHLPNSTNISRNSTNISRHSINTIISLVDEILYYSYEIERTSDSTNARLIAVLDEMDRVNCQHFQTQNKHWTHARDSPKGALVGKYKEGGNCNFLALTIQARLMTYVRTKLDNDPPAIKKYGRPLLDYALRPRRVTPAALLYHTDRDLANVDIDMLQFLLVRGADPNERVFICDSHTVWGLFMLSCFESIKDAGSVTKTLRTAWRKAADLLIDHGADYDCFGGQCGPVYENYGPLTVSTILTEVFGEEQAREMQRRLDENQDKKSWSGWVQGKLKQIGWY